MFYRGFVYDHLMDWRNPRRTTCATAAYNNFHKLDGLFEDNVIVQIKHGPIDFQVREPPSPLFGGLAKTNQAIELQITQEYLGQQRHLRFRPRGGPSCARSKSRHSRPRDLGELGVNSSRAVGRTDEQTVLIDTQPRSAGLRIDARQHPRLAGLDRRARSNRGARSASSRLAATKIGASGTLL